MTEQRTHQQEVTAVIDELALSMHELFPHVAPASVARFGSALANMFDQIWQTQVRNMLPFVAQGETNRTDIERLQGQVSDLRTVQGDLMQSREEFEQRLEQDEARLRLDEDRLSHVEQRLAALELRMDEGEARIAEIARAVAPEDMVE
jgi:hypothetical protein